MGPRFAALCVAVLVATAGCIGTGGPPAGGTSSTTTATTTTATPTTTSPTSTTTTRASTTTMEYEYGTEFVYVEKLDNQSRYVEWPPEERAHFENMTEERREVFLDALEGRVEFGPDEDNPFAFNDQRRPRVVRYEGVWYRVQVAIV